MELAAIILSAIAIAAMIWINYKFILPYEKEQKENQD